MSGGPTGLLHQVVRFLLGSCLGLAVDLAVFQAAVLLGATPGVANAISSGCAVVVVYLFVTKYAFSAERSRTSFLLFVGWYVTSIVIFSVLIEVLHGATGWLPFVCKLVSLPLSFAANFGASKVLFGRRGDGPATPAGGSGHRPAPTTPPARHPAA
ncbi:GtrA family protein [Modestobacter roseus]|uniref:Putative flippase GtrA n=1 Tax=Modestobacter roseus TaxID=1181884 RepID=A0A562ITD3_9ACTN|nr:GtrA family protein [Modestobacter roseus]TWH74208.1 putative flippase GtrA [Modestobacter roseus]